jgi:hypothetical protein
MKIEEPYSALSPQPPGDHGHPDPERSLSTHSLPTAPTDSQPSAEDVNITSSWTGSYASEHSFEQTEAGAHWEAGSHENVTGSSTVANNPFVEDTAFAHTSGMNTYPLNQYVETNHLAGPYDVPPVAVARQLISNYMRTIQDWIPILPRTFLNEDVNRYYTEPFQVTNVWLATFHLVLAIGARHAHLTDRSEARQPDDMQHYTRATQLLGLIDSAAMTARPDVTLVQVS